MIKIIGTNFITVGCHCICRLYYKLCMFPVQLISSSLHQLPKAPSVSFVSLPLSKGHKGRSVLGEVGKISTCGRCSSGLTGLLNKEEQRGDIVDNYYSVVLEQSPWSPAERMRPRIHVWPKQVHHDNGTATFRHNTVSDSHGEDYSCCELVGCDTVQSWEVNTDPLEKHAIGMFRLYGVKHSSVQSALREFIVPHVYRTTFA